MPFRYKGLPVAPFQPYFAMSEAELETHGARRMIVDEQPGFPCRVTLADAEPGESVVLLSFEHQDAVSPFRASGPVFVREAMHDTFDSVELPPVFRTGRLLSARAYDRAGFMIEADVSPASDLEGLLERLFAMNGVEYIHIHYARRGCYAARVERA